MGRAFCTFVTDRRGLARYDRMVVGNGRRLQKLQDSADRLGERVTPLVRLPGQVAKLQESVDLLVRYVASPCCRAWR